jgi:hypothetical protein
MKSSIPTSAQVKLMLHRCGLSQSDAAAFLGKEDRTVRRWISGEYEMPSENWRALSELCDLQDKTARGWIDKIKQLAAERDDPVPVTIARTDEEARRLRYPCAGALLAVVRRLVEWLPADVQILPTHRDLDPAQLEVMRLREFLNR